MATDGSLNTKQRQAIAALLSSRTVEGAASKAGVGERTLHRWLVEDENFKRELTAAEGRAIDAATRQLVSLQDAAIAVMTSILADKHVAPGVRLRAAQGVLDNLLKLRELRNLEERLTALEERYAEQN